jgi:hypothetical protein
MNDSQNSSLLRLGTSSFTADGWNLTFYPAVMPLFMPLQITHERVLLDVDSVEFLHSTEPLAEKLGVTVTMRYTHSNLDTKRNAIQKLEGNGYNFSDTLEQIAATYPKSATNCFTKVSSTL